MPPVQEPQDKDGHLDTHLKTLRTYQGDVEETIHMNNESLISIATAEQKAKEKDPGAGARGYESFPEKKENILLTYGVLPLVGLILIVVGGGAVVGAYYYIHAKNEPIVVNTEKVLIQYSTKKDVPIGTVSVRKTVEETFAGLTNDASVPGTVTYTNFTQNNTSISSATLFGAIGPSAPDTLLRSLSVTYMSGMFAADGTGNTGRNTPFFIFASDSFGDTYAGMLAWEPTMSDNLAPFFGGAQGNPSTLSGLASTTIPSEPVWSDESFNNHDVRILRNAQGNIVLLYGFIDKNILIITDSEQAFESLVNKYVNARLVK